MRSLRATLSNIDLKIHMDLPSARNLYPTTETELASSERIRRPSHAIWTLYQVNQRHLELLARSANLLSGYRPSCSINSFRSSVIPGGATAHRSAHQIHEAQQPPAWNRLSNMCVSYIPTCITFFLDAIRDLQSAPLNGWRLG